MNSTVQMDKHDKNEEIARIRSERGDHEQALELLRANLAWSKGNLGTIHPVTLSDQENLAFSLNELGQYHEAAALDQDTLHIRKKEKVGEHADILETQHNLALNLFKLGRYQKAANLDRETLKARETALGQKNLDTLLSRHNLAASLHELGQYVEAAYLNRRVLEARKGICSATDPDLISSRHNLASNLNGLERYQEAAKLLEENLSVLRGNGNKGNPQLLISEKLFERNDRAWRRQCEARAARKIKDPPRSGNEIELKGSPESPKPNKTRSNKVHIDENRLSLPRQPLDQGLPAKDSLRKGSSPQQPVRSKSDAMAKAIPTPPNVSPNIDTQKVTSNIGKVKQESAKYPTLAPHHAVESPRPRSKSEQELRKSSRMGGDVSAPSDLSNQSALNRPTNGANQQFEERRERRPTEDPAANRKINNMPRFFDARISDHDPNLSVPTMCLCLIN